MKIFFTTPLYFLVKKFTFLGVFAKTFLIPIKRGKCPAKEETSPVGRIKVKHATSEEERKRKLNVSPKTHSKFCLLLMPELFKSCNKVSRTKASVVLDL